MICYDTWLCKSNPSVVVSLFLGTGTFKYWSLALITDHRKRINVTLPYWHIWCWSDEGRGPVEHVEVEAGEHVEHAEADVEEGGDGAWGDTGDAGLASLRIHTAAHDKSALVARVQPDMIRGHYICTKLHTNMRHLMAIYCLKTINKIKKFNTCYKFLLMVLKIDSFNFLIQGM